MGKLRHNQKRTARLDLRITPRDKEDLDRIAAKTRRTVSSLIEEMIERVVKENPCQ